MTTATLTSVDPEFPISTCSVESWTDPVVDQLGHDPRSAYVERFWLPVLGPSTVWFLRRVADGLDQRPDGFTLDLVDTARSIGVGMRGGRNSPMMRTIERCCRFGAARMHGTTNLSVRRRLAPLTRSQVERLPQSLQRDHDAWLSRPRQAPSFDQMQARARSLALSMLELGEDPETVEQQLHRWRFHPALAFEAMRWALANHTDRTAMATSAPEPESEMTSRPTIGARRSLSAVREAG